MEPEFTIEACTAQLKMLEEQRAWMSAMAQEVGVEEQKKRCSELASRLADKVQKLRARIADLQLKRS